VPEEDEPFGQGRDARLLRRERQLQLVGQKSRKVLLLGAGLVFVARDEHHKIVRVPDGQKHRSSRLAFVVAELPDGIAGAGICRAVARLARRDIGGVPLLDGRQGDVGQERRQHAALRGSGVGAQERILAQHPRLQEASDESAHLRVRDPPAKAGQNVMMVDVVEAPLDVPFDDPLVGRTGPIGFRLHAGGADRVADMLQCVATRPARTEAIRDG
jgi:hypothetical protein